MKKAKKASQRYQYNADGRVGTSQGLFLNGQQRSALASSVSSTSQRSLSNGAIALARKAFTLENQRY